MQGLINYVQGIIKLGTTNLGLLGKLAEPGAHAKAIISIVDLSAQKKSKILARTNTEKGT